MKPQVRVFFISTCLAAVVPLTGLAQDSREHLGIQRVDRDRVRLSWTVSDAVVEEIDNLISSTVSPDAWSEVGLPAEFRDGEHSVIIPVEHAERYYRGPGAIQTGVVPRTIDPHDDQLRHSERNPRAYAPGPGRHGQHPRPPFV